MNVDLQKSDAARAWDAVEEMFPAMPAKPNDKMTLIERESVTNYRYNFLADRAKIILKYFTVEGATEREGKRSILPVAQILARFFGTSVTLWNHLWNTWEKRSKKRSLTVSEGQTAPEVQG